MKNALLPMLAGAVLLSSQAYAADSWLTSWLSLSSPSHGPVYDNCMISGTRNRVTMPQEVVDALIRTCERRQVSADAAKAKREEERAAVPSEEEAAVLRYMETATENNFTSEQHAVWCKYRRTESDICIMPPAMVADFERQESAKAAALK
jgi:hypothetical protein